MSWFAVGPRSEETGESETTEPVHRHFCAMCGSTWSHCDEFCPGPRLEGRSTFMYDYDCPMCVDEEGPEWRR